MLPPNARLSSGRDFARIYRKGRSARSDLFRVSWLITPDRPTRIAVVTSRKLSTKAVRRNLLKRQVRAILRELHPRLKSADIVVQLLPRAIQAVPAKRRDSARQSVIPTLSFDRLKNDLEQLLLRHHLLQSP